MTSNPIHPERHAMKAMLFQNTNQENVAYDALGDHEQ
jgi:hypothetical protein